MDIAGLLARETDERVAELRGKAQAQTRAVPIPQVFSSLKSKRRTHACARPSPAVAVVSAASLGFAAEAPEKLINVLEGGAQCGACRALDVLEWGVDIFFVLGQHFLIRGVKQEAGVIC